MKVQDSPARSRISKINYDMFDYFIISIYAAKCHFHNSMLAFLSNQTINYQICL